MKWILWIVISLIALVGVITIVGYLLPVGHVASRSADFARPPETVFALISDLKNYPAWWPEARGQRRGRRASATDAVRDEDRGRDGIRRDMDDGDRADAQRGRD